MNRNVLLLLNERRQVLDSRIDLLEQQGWDVEVCYVGFFGFWQLFKLCLQKDFRFVWSISNPVWLHLYGFVISLFFCCTWVAEMRDDLMYYKDVFSAAGFWLVRCFSDVSLLCRDNWSEHDGFEMLPYFGSSRKPNRDMDKFSCFTVVYAGRFYDGWITPICFLYACHDFIETHGLTPDDFRIWFYAKKWRPEYDGIISREYYDVRDYVSEQKIYRIYQRSHLLLYIVGAPESSQNKINKKLWDYISSGTPILCISGEGYRVNNIIRDNDLGYVCYENDIASIEKALETAYNNSGEVNADSWRLFRRRDHDMALVEVLDRYLETE